MPNCYTVLMDLECLVQVENNENAHVVVYACIFRRNYAGVAGGGAYLSGQGESQMVATIEASKFDSNMAGKSGGGVAFRDLSSLKLHDTSFIQNSAKTFGGGLYLEVS